MLSFTTIIFLESVDQVYKLVGTRFHFWKNCTCDSFIYGSFGGILFIDSHDSSFINLFS